MLIGTLAVLACALAVLWGIAALFLKGEDLSAFDRPGGERLGSGMAPSVELKSVVASLAGLDAAMRRIPLRERIPALHRAIDEMFANRPFHAVFQSVDCAGVPAEWVLSPGADSARRTLYIRGGGFMIGSPRSHRTLTTRFSAMTGGALLAIDYRLMPEHRRMAGVEDCRTAYRWMLENGPAGPGSAQAVFVAGESAGGNLALSLIAWIRDQRLRAPDAVARSRRRPTARSRARACAPTGRATRCPARCSGDDGRRYINRARAAGSPAKLQTWSHVVHAWHIFNPELPEATAALEVIGKFLAAAARPAAGAAEGDEQNPVADQMRSVVRPP